MLLRGCGREGVAPSPSTCVLLSSRGGVFSLNGHHTSTAAPPLLLVLHRCTASVTSMVPVLTRRLVSSDSAAAAGVFKEPVTLVSPAAPPRDLYRPERLASPRPIISTSVRCMECAAPRRVGFFYEEQAEVLGDDRDHWGRGWFDRLTGDVSSSCCHAALLKRRADRVLSDTDDVQARARYEVVLEGVPHRAFLHTHSGLSR